MHESFPHCADFLDSQGLSPLIIDGSTLSISNLIDVARRKRRVSLSGLVEQRLVASRNLVEKIVQGKSLVYGINTGLGDLSNTTISKDQTVQLQTNLIRSHAVGVGSLFSEDVVRAFMLLQANKLSRGNSGVPIEAVNVILDCLNANIHPLVPSQGSLGASGDLAPLAHAALVYIGEGKAHLGNVVLTGKEALKAKGIQPLKLEPKVGLSLLNGTEVSTALAALAVHDAQIITDSSLVAGAMTLEAAEGSEVPFSEAIHQLRPHPGQIRAARALRFLLRESQITISHSDAHKIQDPYSLRCMPQVIGASCTVIDHCKDVIQIELNSVTDNPLVFAEDEVVLSGGNFHAQPIALAMDYLKTAVAEVANISERRIYLLLDSHRSGLPHFLARSPGLESGLMIAQNVAAALVSENKVLSHPASVDSIPTSAGMEDHVSMAPIAARQVMQIIDNTCNVVALELLVASQGLSFSKGLNPGKGVMDALEHVRKVSPVIEFDRSTSGDVEKLSRLIKSGVFSGLIP